MIGLALWLALNVVPDTGLQQVAEERGGAGHAWIGPLPGNEGRPVLVYVPPGASPAADRTLVVHFHGTYSEHIEKRRDDLPKKRWVGWNRVEQTLDAIDALQATGKEVALVYPLSAGKRKPEAHDGWWNHAFDIRWMEGGVGTLLSDSERVLAEELAVTGRVTKVIAEGHSAGGVALFNIAHASPGSVDEMIFLDASFYAWADGCYRALELAGSLTRMTIVQTERGIADPHRGRTPWCTEADLEEAERWWCDALAADMADVDRVYLHRTKVRHGDQPRHFTGGLELPADRHPR